MRLRAGHVAVILFRALRKLRAHLEELGRAASPDDLRTSLRHNDFAPHNIITSHDAISVLSRFDPLVDLSHAGHLKPDPRAYADGIAAMRRVAGDIDPGEIVYVDDHLDNVVGATDAGMVSLWFDITDPAGSHQRIRSALEGDDPT